MKTTLKGDPQKRHVTCTSIPKLRHMQQRAPKPRPVFERFNGTGLTSGMTAVPESSRAQQATKSLLKVPPPGDNKKLHQEIANFLFEGAWSPFHRKTPVLQFQINAFVLGGFNDNRQTVRGIRHGNPNYTDHAYDVSTSWRISPRPPE